MCRACDGVFVDTRGGREKSRNVVITVTGGSAGNDHAANVDFGKSLKIRRHAANSLFGLHFNQIIELMSADMRCSHAERFQHYCELAYV